MALGSVIDKKADLKQYMFLPDYVHLGLSNSFLNDVKIVKKQTYILPDHNLKKTKTNFFISPLFVSLIILLITIYFTFINTSKAHYWYNTISLVYGLTGLIVLALWFLTEHSTTKYNFNILWANPLLLLYPFLKHSWKQKVNIAGVISFILFLGIALIQTQEFNLCFYILVTCLLPIYFKKLLSFKI